MHVYIARPRDGLTPEGVHARSVATSFVRGDSSAVESATGPEFIGHCQRKPEISCRGTSGLAGIPGGGSGRLNALGATSLTVSG